MLAKRGWRCEFTEKIWASIRRSSSSWASSAPRSPHSSVISERISSLRPPVSFLPVPASTIEPNATAVFVPFVLPFPPRRNRENTPRFCGDALPFDVGLPRGLAGDPLAARTVLTRMILGLLYRSISPRKMPNERNRVAQRASDACRYVAGWVVRQAACHGHGCPPTVFPTRCRKTQAATAHCNKTSRKTAV